MPAAAVSFYSAFCCIDRENQTADITPADVNKFLPGRHCCYCVCYPSRHSCCHCCIKKISLFPQPAAQPFLQKPTALVAHKIAARIVPAVSSCAYCCGILLQRLLLHQENQPASSASCPAIPAETYGPGCPQNRCQDCPCCFQLCLLLWYPSTAPSAASRKSACFLSQLPSHCCRNLRPLLPTKSLPGLSLLYPAVISAVVSFYSTFCCIKENSSQP